MNLTKSLVDQHGRSIRLGTLLGKGGEAAVFNVEDDPSIAAKLYHEARSATQVAKLSHLVSSSTPELLRIAAWPMATLHARPGGPLLGFLMPKMEGFKELHVLYGVKSRRTTFPRADWRFLIHAAMNCAAAFDSLHRAGVVISDVNSRNVCVSPKDATVRVVDCDSFQIVANGEQFLCEVGVPEYTPPELHGKPFTGVVRTPNHDRFGLAVLVFHLLFMGRHPFFGRFSGTGEMTQERAIQELRFAFGAMAAAKQMSAPPNSMPLSILPGSVAALFEAAFSENGVRGDRPSAADWQRSLQQLGAQLRTCAAESLHKYHGTSPSCPWCEAMDKGGSIYFLGEQQPLAFVCSIAELAPLWQELERGLRQAGSALPLLPPSGAATPLPPVLLQSHARLKRLNIDYVASLSSFAATICVSAFSSSPLVAVLAFSSAVAIVVSLARRVWFGLHSEVAKECALRRRVLEAAELEAQECAALQQRHAEETQRFIQENRAESSRIHQLYANLQPAFEAELHALSQNVREGQRRAFLDQYEIMDANIPGFGRDRKARLVGVGIESAWDVLKTGLPEVVGIGEKLRGSLHAWASAIDSQFTFDASRGVHEAERRSLAARYRRQQQVLRADLEKLVPVVAARAVERAHMEASLRQRSWRASAELGHAKAAVVPAPASGWRLVGWTAAVLMLLLIFIGVAASIQTPKQPGGVPPAVVSAAEAVEDPSVPGTTLLHAGAGAPVPFRWRGSETKQRMELTIDASLLGIVSGDPAHPVLAQVLVAAKNLSNGLVEYQFLVERAQIVGLSQQPRSERAARAFVPKLAGSLLALSVTATGRLIGARVLRRSNLGDAAAAMAMEGLISTLARSFVELPQENVAAGMRWRVRMEPTAPSWAGSRSTAQISSASLEEVQLDVGTEYSEVPNVPRSVLDRSNVHMSWKQGDLVPSLDGELWLARPSAANAPSSESSAAQLRIRPL